MERRLKAQNTVADENAGDKIGPSVPNTGGFGGHNPLYEGEQVTDANLDDLKWKQRDVDSSSLSSGNSVLIGVENKAAFGYAGHKDDISLDDLAQISDDDDSINLGKNVDKPFGDDKPRMSIYLQPAFEEQDIQPPVMSLDGANPLYQSDTDV